MVDLMKLRVSLTKNGYIKIADLVIAHPSDQILANVYGVHDGINLQKSQVKNILGADPIVPAFWDQIRRRNRPTVQAFTFLAIVFSHHRLMHALKDGTTGNRRGHIERTDLSPKEFTNLVYAMSELGLCDYQKGMDSVDYDLTRVIELLRPVQRQTQALLKHKLKRTGWSDPDVHTELEEEPFEFHCRHEGFHTMLGMPFNDFSAWLFGTETQPMRPR